MKRLKIVITLIFSMLASGCWQRDIGRSYYPSGKLKTEATVRNGLLDGPAKMFSENGTTVGEANYKAGLLHGKATTFFEDGTKKSEAEYTDGILDGVSVEWAKGERKKCVFFSRGLLRGECD